MKWEESGDSAATLRTLSAERDALQAKLDEAEKALEALDLAYRTQEAGNMLDAKKILGVVKAWATLAKIRSKT